MTAHVQLTNGGERRADWADAFALRLATRAAYAETQRAMPLAPTGTAHPVDVLYMDEFPRAGINKVAKKELREVAKAG